MKTPGPEHEYRDGQEGLPSTSWIAAACRQLGYYCMISQSVDGDGRPFIRLKLPPDMTMGNRQQVLERAMFLTARHATGKPTEPLPDGTWPDSWDEMVDGVALNVFSDPKAKTVVLDLGRAVRAVDLHPAQARVLSTMLSLKAQEVDPDGQALHEQPQLVGVAMVTEEDGTKRQARVIPVLNDGPQAEPEE